MSNYVNLLDIVYPVNSVYITANGASPATTVGGTWTQIESDTFICSGNGTTGGQNQTYLHVSNLPTNVWLTGGTTKNRTGNQPQLVASVPVGNFYGLEAYKINEHADKMYSDTPIDNRPKFIGFNIYRRTA